MREAIQSISRSFDEGMPIISAFRFQLKRWVLKSIDAGVGTIYDQNVLKR
ncbi:hypothetical protein HMPREF0972_00450 [Actinomyces sp. oral taxon 848 str. F0332]|nr:hypothetical protein HMPREF0972_00450 [Actinomyces sp. oral taxon 848 str. F0332]